MFRCSGDDSFGPVLGPDNGSGCYNFDFTLTFEDCIFAIAPCGLLLLLAAWRLYDLARRPAIVRWPLLRAVKQVVYVSQGALQLALVALQGSVGAPRTTLAAGSLAVLSTVALLALSDWEHCRVAQPSPLIQVFLLFTVLLDLPRVRTAWLIDNGASRHYALASLFTATYAVRLFLLGLESILKWKHVAAGLEIPPERRQGIFGRTFFWWLMPLFLKGYRGDISMDDLFAIDDELKGEVLFERLERSWNSVDRKGKHCFTTAVFRTFFPELALAIVPRLMYVGFSLAQPYLIGSMITFITFHDRLPGNYGYGLVGAYALCYLGLALCQRTWMQVAFRTMTKIRGSMVTMIFRKMLAVRTDTTNSSAALSLMSTDVDRITMTTFMCVNLGPDVVQLIIALVILGLQLGATTVAPVILTIICVGIAAHLGKMVPPRQRRWMAAIQRRVGITSDIISSMKGVKVAGLSGMVEDQIQGLRDYELDRSIQFRKMQVSTQLLGMSPTLLMPAVTFTVYAIAQSVSGGSQFGVAQAFTSLGLLNVLVGPVMDLTSAWTNLSSGLACLDRIQAFLLREDRDDYRMLMSSSPSGRTSSLSTEKSELKSRDNHKSSQIITTITSDKPQPVIKIRGGFFGWTKNGSLDTAVTKDIDLDIRPGELTLLVGPVASGKSTLLKAMLGEARIVSGSVEFTIPEEVAYCGEDAWLLNHSVKENILAFELYHKDRYDEVVTACQLDEDFSHFPKGDDSIIGSRGISLSGGQKQRVALARAVYNRKPIIILDDIFKGLDADTYAKCFNATLGPRGLLRQNGTAIILATHNVQLLPHAEHIVVLGEDGRISEKGSFDELNAPERGGYVCALGLKKAAVKEIEAVVAEERRDEKLEKEAALDKIAALSSRSSSSISSSNRATAPGGPDGKKGKPQTKSRGKRNSDALTSYVKSMGKWSPVFICFALANVGFRSAQPLWLNVWTASIQQNPTGTNTGYYVGIYILFGLLNVLFLGLQFWIFMIIIVPHSAKLLHKKVLTAVMHAPLTFFVATDTGEIVNRFSQDMTLVDLQLPMSFMQGSSQVVNAVAQIVLTCVGSGWLGVAIPAMLAALFGLQKFYLRTSRQMRLLDLEAKSPLYSHFISTFSGLAAVRAYGWTGLVRADNLGRLDESQRPFYLLRCVMRWLTLVLNLMVAGLAVLLAGIAVALRGSISPGLLGVALTSIMGIGQTLSQLIQSWTQLETSLGAVTRIDGFAANTPREPDGPDMPPDQWPSRGHIRIEGLCASYDTYSHDTTPKKGQQANDQHSSEKQQPDQPDRQQQSREVLSNINLDILPGQKVAVCGRSGSGKSTLISMLLRLYEPTAGHVVVDDIDTRTLNLDALRESLVALPQDPMFLAGTVRYNLDPLSRCSGDDGNRQLWDALEKVGIREAVEAQDGGLDAELNTDWLSAGQRQLFCLARALLRNSKVIMLDEATSSLDRETEARVDELIRTAFTDWTAIVVAHRLKTVADFDKVLVLQEGRAVEYDSPQNLLARPDSKFRMLWDLQGS